MFINVNARKNAAQERKNRVPVRYPLLRPGAIDLFDEGADVLVGRHDAGERVRVEGLCTTFPG